MFLDDHRPSAGDPSWALTAIICNNSDNNCAAQSNFCEWQYVFVRMLPLCLFTYGMAAACDCAAAQLGMEDTDALSYTHPLFPTGATFPN